MNPKFEELYNRLNEDQKKAVDTIDGPVLVIAGPGTGKTQILSLRIANILRQTDTDPKSILCLTFTDAGVIAMKNRLQSIIGNAAFKVQIHTFHSFCSEIIRSFPYEFEFTDEVQAIKDIDKLGIFREILLENKLTSLQQRNDVLGNFKGIVSTISTLKKEFITPDKFKKLIQNYELNLDPKKVKLEQKRVEKMYDLHKFYEKYLELMKERNLIDFDDMIFKVTEAFSKNEDLVKHFQEQYLYTLVDEYQDTNNAQLEVIKSVANFEGIESNIFAVGDDDQTIYRFQGAESKNFQTFLDIFPSTEIIVLHTNYRSNQEIIDASTNVIENNPGRITQTELFEERGLDKVFKAFEDSTKYEVGSANNPPTSYLVPRTQIHDFEHSFHEDYWIGLKIKELVDSGIKLNEIALITRVNRQIVNITKFLDKFKIPYTIKRSESILDNKYIQNLLQLFEIIADPIKIKNDQIMWEVLTQDFVGLNSFDVFALVHEAKKEKTCMYDFVTKTHLPKYEEIYKFVNTIIALQVYSQNNNFLNTFTKVLHSLNIVKFVETLPESYAEINRISSLFQFGSTRCKFIKTYTILDFLNETKLMREKNISLASDPIDIDSENKINILTAHSSKGLEFDHVFIYQAIENKWEKMRGGRDAISLPPLSESVDVSEQEEAEIDERRLFYVAMTRAKKNLFITYSKKYFDSDSGEVDAAEKIQSKFLIESKISNQFSHKELVQNHDDIMKMVLTSEEPVEIPDKNKVYLEGLVTKHLNLSASKMNKYNNCGYKFLLEDIFELPSLKSLNLEIGTSIHKGIELLTKSVSKTKSKPLDFDTVLSLAKEEFDRNIDKDEFNNTENIQELGSLDVAYAEIERGLRAYYDYFIINPDKPEFSEFITFGTFEGIKLRGRIDKVSYKLRVTNYELDENFVPNEEEKNILTITDYKTTSRIPSVTEFLGLTKNSDKNHLRQLLFYRLLIENSEELLTKSFATKLNQLRIEYIDTKLGEVKVYELPKAGIFSYQPRSNSKKFAEFDIDAEYEEFKNDLKKTFGSIQNLVFNRTEDRSMCQFCQFKRHCGR